MMLQLIKLTDPAAGVVCLVWCGRQPVRPRPAHYAVAQAAARVVQEVVIPAVVVPIYFV